MDYVLAVAVYENEIYAFGGQADTAERSKCVKKYNAKENKWIEVEAMNKKRYLCAPVVFLNDFAFF